NKLSELEQPIPQLSFQHLANFRQTPNIVQLQGPKQKYRFVKCFIENTKVELFEHQENIVSMHIGNPLRVQHKARHMRNITNITNNENEERVVATQAGKTRERYCKKCHQTGHYAPQCPNV
ncbi:19415_t:CDS:2, partial [Rhizophagus irregularis]